VNGIFRLAMPFSPTAGVAGSGLPSRTTVTLPVAGAVPEAGFTVMVNRSSTPANDVVVAAVTDTGHAHVDTRPSR
jgi:hypothetical protein